MHVPADAVAAIFADDGIAVALGVALDREADIAEIEVFAVGHASIAQAPVVQATDEEGMLAYFKRVQPPKGKLFPGGLSWVNREGTARISSNQEQPLRIADVSDRSYFRQPMRTGAPFVMLWPSA